MKKKIMTLAAILFFTVFTGFSIAESLEVTGVVKALSDGKITIADAEGNQATFSVDEETSIAEGIKTGSKVTVEAEEGKALFVDAVEE